LAGIVLGDASTEEPSHPARASTGTPLRILFVVERGTLLRFALLLPELAERGHEIHIGFPPSNNWRRNGAFGSSELPPRTLALVESLCSRYDNVHYALAPRRADTNGWSRVAWMVRGLADLAHNASPRYAHARGLRRRTKKRILKLLVAPGEFEPVGRRLMLRATKELTGTTDARRSRSGLKLAARLEEAIPTSKEVDSYLRTLSPDVVVATGTFRHVSSEVEFLKSARRMGIPGAVFVASWDNLTNKGSLKFTPERVFVWNEIQAEEAVELHGIPRERVRTTGAHVFDEWFERRPSRTREELLAELGLDPAQPYLVYLCSSRNVARPTEFEFVRRWIEALRSSGDERLRRINVVVRPHPNAAHQWKDVQLGFEHAVVWPASGVHPIAEQARADFFDTLAHSAAVVGINTTAMIEAAILGKSVLTVLVSDFAQATTLHFHNLLTENGGFLHVAANLDEHTEQLGRVLDEDAAGAERRRRFVESFVRPGGLDRPAAPIAVAAIEDLAGVPVQATARPGLRLSLLRVALSVEAGLNAVYASYCKLRAMRQDRKIVPAPSEAPASAAKERTPWLQLDERDEYRQACRVRLQHVVPVREPLVLVSQIQRSGGTLLSRLFDGHPECHAHPYELKMGRKTTPKWPELDLDSPRRWFRDLYEPKVAEHMLSGYTKPGLKETDVDVFPFIFLPRLQKLIFDECATGGKAEHVRDIFDWYFTSYFNAWLDNQNLYSGPKRIVTGFTPRTNVDFPSIERFFAAYPDGTLVSIVREPRAWFASAVRHRPEYADLDASLGIWRRSAEAGIEAKGRFGDRVVLITYEELVLETEAAMRRLAERLGISMSPILLVPTFNGREVRANSSDPVSSYGIVSERVDAYRDVLDSTRIARIDELAGDLYERLRHDESSLHEG
jgi:sulfotransferase family protein